MSVDVCLVSPPQRACNHYHPPLALMLLSSFLEKNGVKTEIIDPKSITEVRGQRKSIIMNQILQQIDELDPKIVGITCYTPEFNDVVELAMKIKEKKNGIKIIIGGVHPTLRPGDFFFENSPVDFVVIGEGEITLYELAFAILNGNKIYETIKGIAYFDKNEYFQTESRPLIHDLDEMPFPAYEKVDMKYYTAPNPYAVRGLFLSSFHVLVGRGCLSQCTFCVNVEMRKIFSPGKSLRCRSAKNVVDEIEFLKKRYKIDSVYFSDYNFTSRRDLVFDICEGLIKRKLQLLWGCSARIDTLSEKLLLRMKMAGCVQVDLGVESGSDAVLKRLKKGITVKQIKNVFKICNKIGIRTLANILINVPDETKEEINNTLEFLDKIKPSVTLFNIFIPYLGTEIYKNSNLNLKPHEYSLLAEPRFRFAKHNIDFNKFYIVYHKKYNSMLNFLPDYFSAYYLRQLIRSGKKKEYLLQLKNLFKEYIKQVHQ